MVDFLKFILLSFQKFYVNLLKKEGSTQIVYDLIMFKTQLFKTITGCLHSSRIICCLIFKMLLHNFRLVMSWIYFSVKEFQKLRIWLLVSFLPIYCYLSYLHFLRFQKRILIFFNHFEQNLDRNSKNQRTDFVCRLTSTQLNVYHNFYTYVTYWCFQLSKWQKT